METNWYAPAFMKKFTIMFHFPPEISRTLVPHQSTSLLL
jgi:hypothetical protein